MWYQIFWKHWFFYTKVRIYTHSLSEMVESKFRCTNAEFVLRKSFRYRWLFTPSKRMVKWINSPALFLAWSCNATADVAILTCLAFSSSSSDELSSVILSSYAFWIKIWFKNLIYRIFGFDWNQTNQISKITERFKIPLTFRPHPHHCSLT